ncbi:MAG: AmmeMemoRadiSam system radical SAM enzyme [Nanoarchaeota archaeon]
MNGKNKEKIEEFLKDKKAELFEKISDKTIKCLACKHYCQILEGKTGICGVRANFDNELFLLVKNRPSAIAIDPIEKKPLYHFKPGTRVYSIGTLGCNFRCLWCQNWQLSQTVKEFSGFDAEKALAFVLTNSEELKPEEAVNEALATNSQGIAYTYNEPTIFVEYAKEIAALAKEKGLFNVFVSSGYESDETLKYLNGLIDAFNVDLKAYGNKTYLKYTGAMYDKILDTIEKLYKKGVWLEITTLVIPKVNDDEESLKNIASFIASLDVNIPWHITRFHPDYKMLNVPPTPIETLLKAKKIGEKEGLNFIYIGNVPNKEFNSTYCPNCGNLVIEREFFLVKNYLENGRCPYCGFKIPGVWG